MDYTIHHPAHPDHPLSLLVSQANPGVEFSCDGCGNQGKGSHFHCELCSYDLHQECASLTPLFSKDCHIHPLRLTYVVPYPKNRFTCKVCEQSGSNQWLYRCNLCSFDIHLICALRYSHQKDEVVSDPIPVPVPVHGNKPVATNQAPVHGNKPAATNPAPVHGNKPVPLQGKERQGMRQRMRARGRKVKGFAANTLTQIGMGVISTVGLGVATDAMYDPDNTAADGAATAASVPSPTAMDYSAETTASVPSPTAMDDATATDDIDFGDDW